MSSESVSRIVYPFSAVYGLQEAKKALLCALVNPELKSVLIRGPSGVAKTTLVRAISEELAGKTLVNIPLNATNEQLFGGLDLQQTLLTGTLVEELGLMMRANGNLAYIDDINLIDTTVLTSLLNIVDTGKVMVEREGISAVYDYSGLLIGTMNPDDFDFSPHILDRFDLCVYISAEEDAAAKEEILKRNIEFNADPQNFIKEYCQEEMDIKENIERARKLLPYVTISDELITIIVELCSKIGAEGHRGDLAMLHASLTLAALNGRDEVSRKDVEEAAMLCLPHRRDYTPKQTPPKPSPPQETEQSTQDDHESNNDPQIDNRQNSHENASETKMDDSYESSDAKDEQSADHDDKKSLDNLMFQIGNQFRVIDYLGDEKTHLVKTKSRNGRRAVTESGDGTGRYARYRLPDNSVRDIAFDATLRAAAPFQTSREHERLAIVVEKQDLREKVRERKCGCTLLFLVDASGSLGVRKRMIAVKGAILSMLKESYVKRDRIGMMAFRRDSAELILPPTKSVEYSYKRLAELPTGGKTPLAAALLKAQEYMTVYVRSHPGERCYIILLTDGRANVPLAKGASANDEVQEIAENISLPGVKWIVVDTSAGYPHFDNACKLAQKVGATYFKLEDLNAETLSQNVKLLIN